MLTKAAQLGGEVARRRDRLRRPLARREAGDFGIATVWVADDERLAAPLPQPRVDVLAKLVRDEGYDTVLFAQSVLAADIAAALAARWTPASTGTCRSSTAEGWQAPALQDTV